ncbi:hypothetical protein EVAR_92984_1 [Eumeta japonica]|uniref:Uncharacterized protein n=1 Tax=Eumeta variegata TaxID=151549 RepID=A0A4C1TDH3_EUMVA|nr:hypothetical protein EVAR_92984_1 [Eumeta japonica]
MTSQALLFNSGTIQLRYYSTPVLFNSGTIQLRYYSTTVLFNYGTIQLRYYSTPVLFNSGTIQLQYYSTPVLFNSGTIQLRYYSTPVLFNSGTIQLRRTGVRPSGSRCSPPPMDTRNPRGMVSLLLVAGILDRSAFSHKPPRSRPAGSRELNIKSVERGARRPYISYGSFVWNMGVCGACEADGGRGCPTWPVIQRASMNASLFGSSGHLGASLQRTLSQLTQSTEQWRCKGGRERVTRGARPRRPPPVNTTTYYSMSRLRNNNTLKFRAFGLQRARAG